MNFPQLPNYAFSWRSIQIEPIPNSGERITLGAIIKADDDALIVAKLVPYSKLKAIYGKAFGGKLNEAFNICVGSAEDFYSTNPLTETWIPPLSGFHTSTSQRSVANNIEEGLIRTARNCSSLSISMETSKSNKTDTINPTLWRKEILEKVIVHHENFESCFNQTVQLSGSGVPLKFGFISTNYAAQFDTVSPNNAARQSGLVRAQSKLWQLDQLRDSNRLFHQNKYELLLRLPKYEKDDNQLISDFVEELTFEAARKELGIYPVSDSNAAANHIIECAA